MSIVTYPLNNVEYVAEDAELFHCTRKSGVWADNSFTPFVTGTNNSVTISKGVAWIQNTEFAGKVVALKQDVVVDLGTASTTLPRIDVVALQFNASLNKTEIVVKQGTPASSPKMPEISRTGTVYELYLASVLRPVNATTISVGSLTDLRMDENVCGLMADSVTSVDTKAINTQIMALINDLSKEIENVKGIVGLMFESDWAENGILKTSKGGTGLTTSPTMTVNLETTKGDSIFKENPSPGVKGRLPVTNGGTGTYSYPMLRSKLGLGQSTDALSAKYGGTGATTAKDALKNLMIESPGISLTGNNIEDQNSRYIPGIGVVIIDVRVRVNSTMDKDTWYNVATVPTTFAPRISKALAATYGLTGSMNFSAIVNSEGKINIKPSLSTGSDPNFTVYINGIYVL